MAEPAVLLDDDQVVPFLRAMELDRDALIAVVDFAESQRALCTGNDVRGFDLITVHDKAARGLRETFCGPRWERDEVDNQAGIRNPHLKIRIIPCNFDEHAGNPDRQPTNRVIKGAASSSKTWVNQTGWIPGLPIPQPPEDDYRTWVLGIHADDNRPIGAELSHPLGFSGGRYSNFVPRVILLWGPRPPAGASRLRPDREGPVEDVDIAIRRR
jgi:hypothetical protein